MRKIIDFLKKNVVIHIGVGIWLGVMGAVYVIYSNAEVSSGLSAGSVAISKTNMSEVPEATLQSALDYLYEKASHVGEEGCPDKYDSCVNKYSEGYYIPVEQLMLSSNLKICDLVKMTPTETSFTYHSSTIHPQKLDLWRVIRKNNNGTLDMVSEYVSSDNLTFSGYADYANYIGILNEFASYYENSTYTIGSRMMEYDSTQATEYITDTSAFNGRSKNAPWTSLANGECDTDSLNCFNANETLGAGDMGYETDYNLVQTAYIGTVYDTDNSITTDQALAYRVGSTSALGYWLASRYYRYRDSSRFSFESRAVVGNGTIGSYGIRFYNTTNYNGWRDYGYSVSFRPIVVLKSDINILGKDLETGAYLLD